MAKEHILFQQNYSLFELLKRVIHRCADMKVLPLKRQAQLTMYLRNLNHINGTSALRFNPDTKYCRLLPFKGWSKSSARSARSGLGVPN
jgi:hypothetical protein